MKITNRSALTGKIHSKEIPVTPEQIALWKSGTLIHDAMPNLTDDDRKFILTGITPEEWDSFLEE